MSTLSLYATAANHTLAGERKSLTSENLHKHLTRENACLPDVPILAPHAEDDGCSSRLLLCMSMLLVAK